jgi:hypothetical protein
MSAEVFKGWPGHFLKAKMRHLILNLIRNKWRTGVPFMGLRRITATVLIMPPVVLGGGRF